MGIEPTYSAWKADVLPLNYTRICPVPESNQRHEDFQSSALPTELTGPAVLQQQDNLIEKALACQELFAVPATKAYFYSRRTIAFMKACDFHDR